MMSRLKTLLACVGLSSLRTRISRKSRDTEDQPISPRIDEFKINPANRWRDWNTPAEAQLQGVAERLSDTLMSLRRILSDVAEHAPLAAEPEAASNRRVMVYDRDLFDGEPAFAGHAAPAISGLDDDLFEEAAPATRRAPAPSPSAATCELFA